MAVNSYKDLTVWQKAMDLVIWVYKLTEYLPQEERFGLTSQMRRAAVSIPSNVAEGQRRKGRKEYSKFVTYAYGSGAELETQFEIVQRLGYLQGEQVVQVNALLIEVMKMLNGLIVSLEESVNPTTYNLRPTTL